MRSCFDAAPSLFPSVPRHCYVEHGVNIQIDRPTTSRARSGACEERGGPPSYHFNDCVMEWTAGSELREPSRNVWQPREHWNSCTGQASA